METIKGYIEHIVYRNEQNGYTVLYLSTDNDEEITCVGSLPYINEGELIEAQGSYTVHASYGEQFKIESYEIKDPEDVMAVERYLASGAIKGIGSALAARIVRRFKEDTFRIIEQEPERLAEIKGISERKAREIAEQVAEKRDIREAFIFLSRYGISNNLAVKIYQQYGQEIYRIIRENPYRLADDITGVGFKIADEIARRAGIAVDSDFRVKSGIVYTLMMATGEGNLYLPMRELHQKAEELLGVEVTDLDRYLMDLSVEHKVVIRKDPPKMPEVDMFGQPMSQNADMFGQEEPGVKVYASSLYYKELNTAKMLCDMNVTAKPDLDAARKKILAIEKRTGCELDEKQMEAVLEAVRCGVLVLTGGPGTGKTTTINTMISYFEREGMDIALAAPTGRAAKRMTEATGHEAKTIHRLLEVEGGNEATAGSFGRNSANPLEYDVVIVDEMSMVDIYLMHALLSALVPGTRLILVGDVSQLPSVGPGSVLKDIIDSGVFTVVRLTRIFRQAEQSDIVVNAHKINRGEHMVLDNKSRDFFFLKRDDANVIISIVIELVRDKMPKYVNANWDEIQVLTPTRKGLIGVERLNRILQRYLNPQDGKKGEYTHGDTLFREGDKVMQIKNNYQLEWELRGKYGYVAERGQGVFNGDIGKVVSIDKAAEHITVRFEDARYVEYPYSGLDELEHAYAVTIHKSQGSEYPAVVMPLLNGPKMLMNRNLLYTGITRAKGCVTIVGDPNVYDQMIDNTYQQKRYTDLCARLQELNT